MHNIAPDRPLFVLGTPRSGTTLTAKILGRHPDLFMPGETHYFDDIYSRRNEIGSLAGESSRAMLLSRLSTLYRRYYELPDQERIDKLFENKVLTDEFMASCSSYQDAFSWFMYVQMKTTGKNRWGNNAPRDLFSYSDILSFYPDARFIVCVRDIRDFLVSYKGKWKVTGDDHVERLKKLYHPVITSLLWKSSMREVSALINHVEKKNSIIVRYEDLVQRPEKTVRDICATIDVDYFPSMLEIDANNSSTASSETGIFSTSVGRWAQKLPVEDTYIAQLLAKNEMINLSYDLVDTRPDYLKVIVLFIMSPLALWRGLSANKDVRGPLIPYLARRLHSLISIR